MKRFLFTAILVLAISCQHHGIKSVANFAVLEDSTVQVMAANGGRGTGSYIGNKLLLTAYHVVQDPKMEMWYNVKDKWYQAKLKHYHIEFDLAILELQESHDLPALRFATTAPKLGDIVYTCGYHFGEDMLKLSNMGHVTSIVDREGELSDFLFHNAPSNRGCSGSAVVNSNFEIIAMIQFGVSSNGDYAGIVGSTHFNNILKFVNTALK
jgi:serine protease Do